MNGISILPPRSPHPNGKVERVQKTALEEFWPTVDLDDPELGTRLAEWQHFYNREPARQPRRPRPDRPAVRPDPPGADQEIAAA